LSVVHLVFIYKNSDIVLVTQVNALERQSCYDNDKCFLGNDDEITY